MMALLSLLMTMQMLLVLVNAEVGIKISCLGSNDWRLVLARRRLGCIEAMCLGVLPIMSL